MGFGLAVQQVHSHNAAAAVVLPASKLPGDLCKSRRKTEVLLGLPDHANLGLRIGQLRSGRSSAKKGTRSFEKSASARIGGRVVGSVGGYQGSGRSWERPGKTVLRFWEPFWSRGVNLGAGSGLGFNAGEGDSGAGSDLGFDGGGGGGGGGGDLGAGDGGGGSGSSGYGSGGFESSRGDIRASDLVEKNEKEDEEEAARAPDYRVPGLASLSSAAGDALDGEAPFGDVLLGRNKRAAATAEETATEKAPSRNSDTAGGIGFLRKIDEAAHSFLSSGSQGGSSGPSSGDVLVEKAATHAAHLIQQNDGNEALAKRSETAALRRLQREAFSELLRIRERLDKLEFFTGLRPSKTQSSFGGNGAAKTRLKGEVSAGGAFVLLDDQTTRQSRAALEQAGLLSGLDVRFTFDTPYREKDVMITECSAGRSGSTVGGPISVTKLVYNAQVTNDFNVVVAPLGARGSDVTETVNPLQGQALTQFARAGPAMYHHCTGSALGAAFRTQTALLSLSQFVSGWGSSEGPVNTAPLCLSTLANVLFQPWENSVFSISAVNRFWPSFPVPSFRGLHWSEMGPLVLSKSHHHSNRRGHRSGSSSPQMSSPRDLPTSIDNTSMRDSRTSMDIASLRDFQTSMDNTSLHFRTSSENPSGFSANAAWGTSYGEAERGGVIAVPESRGGSAQQSIAVAGEIDVGANMSLAGWAQADREYWLQESENKEIEWGVSLTKTVGTTAGWGLCVGSSRVDLWSAARDENTRFSGTRDGLGDPCDMQLQMEAFMKLDMGRGFTLQPGLVYLLNKQSQTPALVLRSSWAL